MTWEGETPPGRLTKRQRTWRAKRSVRVLGADGIPPIENPGGTVPQITEDDRKRFLAFLDVNAAEVATWPKWKRDAYTLIKEPSDG